MRRADRMDVDARSLLRQPARRSGMVKVDMGEEDVADIGNGIAVFSQTGLKCWNCRPRPAFDEDCSVGMGQKIHGDRSSEPKEM
jgi:hypothetical protein